MKFPGKLSIDIQGKSARKPSEMKKISNKITNLRHRWNLYWARQRCSGTPGMKKIYGFGKRIAPLVPGIRHGWNYNYVRAISLLKEIRKQDPSQSTPEEIEGALQFIDTFDALVTKIGGSYKDFGTRRERLARIKEQLNLALVPKSPKIPHSFNSLLSAFQQARQHLSLSKMDGTLIIKNLLRNQRVNVPASMISIGYNDSAAEFHVWAGYTTPSFTVQRDDSIITHEKDFPLNEIENIINKLISSLMSIHKTQRVDLPAPMIEPVPVEPVMPTSPPVEESCPEAEQILPPAAKVTPVDRAAQAKKIAEAEAWGEKIGMAEPGAGI